MDRQCSDYLPRTPGGTPVDQNLFNEICLQQLTLSGVHEGETIAVLTRGDDR